MSSLFEWYAMLLTEVLAYLLESGNHRKIHLREFGSGRNHPPARSIKCSLRRDLKEAFTVFFPKRLHVVFECPFPINCVFRNPLKTFSSHPFTSEELSDKLLFFLAG